MSTNKNLTKKIILSISAIVMFILANIGLAKFNNSVKVSAANETSKLTITNSEFANNKNQSYPYATPSGYTAYIYDEQVPSGQKNENCGVINLSNEDYSSRFKTALSGCQDKYCLMLTSSDANLRFGYRTNDTLTLSANSNYIISAMAYTESTAKIGSITLYNEDGSIYSEIKDISSNRTWGLFNLVVTTGNEDVKVTVGLNIKGKGTILFDSLSALQVSSNHLQSTLKVAEQNPDNYHYVNNLDRKAIEYVYTIKNENFTQHKLENDQLVATDKIFNISKSALSTEDTVMNIESSGYYNSSMSINHEKETYSAFATGEDFLTIKQNSIYKITVTAKTENLSGNAYLRLIQKDSENTNTNAEISISSNTTSSVNNNYVNYNFYVLGNPKKDVTYKFEFALGNNETKAIGKLSIAGITTTKINYNTYNNDSDSNSKKINLNEDYIYSDSKIYLDNATFDGMEVSDYSKPYPANVTNWNATGKNNQYYGVVNTSKNEFEKLTQVVNVQNPFGTETNENLLFMYNNNLTESLSYTSNNKTLEPNNYYRFAINVQAQNAPVKVSLVTTKNENEVELVSKSIQTGVKNWETVELYVKTGFEKIDVALKLSLDCKNLAAYAYADNAEFNYPTPTASQFDLAANKVDLTNLLANENLVEQSKEENIITELLNIETDDLSKYVIDEQSFTAIDTKNVMLIKALNDKFYTVKLKTGFNLTADKIYKISVSVYTQNIGTNLEDVEAEKLGASIKLSSFEDTFTSVVSDGKWTTYTFFVKPDSDTTSTCFELSIGSEETPAKGDVFFGNIQITTDNEETFGADFYDENLANEFKVVSAKDTVKVLNTVKVEETDTDTEENDQTEETSEKSGLDKQTLLYLIPSIIFAIAIVLAVVCTLVRKIKWKKPSKKAKKSEYDRSTTVNKQVYARRAAVLRETKVRELKKKLEELTNERNRFEEEYKQTLSKIRELKIKRADKLEIAKLEKDLRKNQKSSASIGLSINKVTRELEYAKTEPYLQALMKRLHQEKLENYNPDENK